MENMTQHPDDLTLFRVMRRPRWIGALVFALVVAGCFAGLGRWQFQRAVDTGNVGPKVTETSVPITRALVPGSAIATASVGQLVSATVSFVPGDYTIISDRLNGSDTGYWLVAHATLVGSESDGKPIALAVARGFTSSRTDALASLATLNAEAASTATLSGRVLPTEPPEQPDDNESGTPPQIHDMSVATLINLWHGVDDSAFYEAYLVSKTDIPAGLTAIYSPPPIQQAAINWLNAFYAAEWVVFAGFAVYLWYRLARDTWEREVDDAREALEAERAANAEKVGSTP